MKKLSLQLRLILSFFCISSLIWCAAAISSWYESREQFDEFFDTYQTRLARQLSTAEWKNLTPDTQKKIDHIIDNLNDNGEEEDEAIGFAIFNSQGKMIFNDGQKGAHFSYNPNASGFVNQNIGKKNKLWRIIWMKNTDGQFTIAVGQELEFRNDAAMDLVEETILPWLIGLLILMLSTIWLVSKQLRPLKQITAILNQRSPDDLSALCLSDIPTEIAPVINSLNSLFEQINQMLSRERSFTSDSAHELRSPLTALKVQLEVAELAKDDPSARKQALYQLKNGIERASRLVEQLLALSRLESKPHSPEKTILDWENIVKECLEEQKETIQNSGATINLDISGTPPVNEGSSLLWSLLLRNLVDNALRYSPAKKIINIIIKHNELSVINSGVTVDEQYLPRLSERFFRPPGQNQSGSGLGLSIVTRIAAIHNCKISFSNLDNSFKVTISPC